MRKKKLKFTVGMQIEELSRVSLNSGVFFCKTKLTHGGDFAEQTSRESVESTCVKWKNKFEFNCKLSANPNTGVLETCLCRISVRKEVKGGKSFDKVGYVDVNLAEYAGAGMVTRHYILEGYNEKKGNRQDNCILKISATMTLTSGDPVYKPQEKQTDFLMMGLSDTLKSSTSDSYMPAGNTATGGSLSCVAAVEPSAHHGPVRRACSESLDLPLCESPTHHGSHGHKRNVSNGSTVYPVYHSRNPSGDLRNCGPPPQILSHSRQSSGTTADSACADLDTIMYQSPLQRNKRSTRKVDESTQKANALVNQLFDQEDMDLDTSHNDEGIELTMFLEDGVSTMSKIETRRRDRNPAFVEMANRFKTL